MPAVKVYAPKFSVSLYKTRQRTTLGAGAPAGTRFSATAPKIDLTPYFGEGSNINTVKGVSAPAGGFTLLVPDKPYAGTKSDDPETGAQIGSAETLYALVEPMDVIEIRMRHGHGSDELPIVMRGFVSEVSRRQQMGPSGPLRSVLIAGQDYGKLWQQLQIYYLPGYVVGQDYITAFRLFERFGVGFQTSMKVGEFVRTVIGEILDPYLQGLMPESAALPRTVVMDEEQLVQHGTTSVSGPQNREGTIYDLLRSFTDVGPWNELFLEDREDGVYCVFRPNPFKRLDGSPIVADQVMPETVEIPASDLMSLNVSRSDANVANYFWVRAPRFELVQDILLRQDQVLSALNDTVLLQKYENTTDRLYGVKLMEVTTEMGGDDVQSFTSGLPAADNAAREALMANWLNYRRRLLVETNRDNVVLESGSATIRGNEAIRPGRYLRVMQGKMAAEFYVSNVAHALAPMQSFTTTVALERGTGFVERAARGGGAESPYFAELSRA